MSAELRNRPVRNYPLGVLTSHLSTEVEVFVVVQHREAPSFHYRGNERVDHRHCSVLAPRRKNGLNSQGPLVVIIGGGRPLKGINSINYARR